MGNCLSCAGQRFRNVERQPLLGSLPPSGTNATDTSSAASAPNLSTSSTPLSSPIVPSENLPSSSRLFIGTSTNQETVSSSSLLPEATSGQVEATRQIELLDSVSHAVGQLASGSRVLGNVRTEMEGVRGEVAAARGEVATMSQQVVETAERSTSLMNIHTLLKSDYVQHPIFSQTTFQY